MLRQDYIGRLIQQLFEALARMTQRLAEGRVDDAELELKQAEQALGMPRGMELFDARSVALMAGRGDKVVLAALIAEQHAALAAARGDDARAEQHRTRALALLEEANPHELVQQAAALRSRLAP